MPYFSIYISVSDKDEVIRHIFGESRGENTGHSLKDRKLLWSTLYIGPEMVIYSLNACGFSVKLVFKLHMSDVQWWSYMWAHKLDCFFVLT